MYENIRSTKFKMSNFGEVPSVKTRVWDLEGLDLEPPRARDKVPGVRALTSARLCQPLSVTRQGAWQTCSKAVCFSQRARRCHLRRDDGWAGAMAN